MGIDPGRNGALCVVDNLGHIVEIHKMPETKAQMGEILQNWEPGTPWHEFDVMAVLEKVGAFRGNSPQSMFNFGRNYGQLEASLFWKNIPTEEVTPQKWQQHYQLGHKADFPTDTAWKSHLWHKAQMLYPKADIKKYAADAVLIARYCWERFK